MVTVNAAASRILICFFTCVFLISCTSSRDQSYIIDTNNKDFSSMYLRGVFNWWEATDDFRLLPIADSGDYGLTMELIADGQPYDFKVADGKWSDSLNCGAKSKVETIRVGETVALYCGQDSLNLQFSPKITGRYEFRLSSTWNGPRLSIQHKQK